MSDTEAMKEAEDVVEEMTDEAVQVVEAEEGQEATITEETTEEVTKQQAEEAEEQEDDTSKMDDLTAQVDELSKSIEEKEEAIKQLEAYKVAIESLLETKRGAIPEEFIDLLPDGDALMQINWITKAEEKGLFEKKKNPEVEIGSFVEAEASDTAKKRNENMTARELLSLGAKGLFSK